MATHFEAYIERFGENADLTRAVLQLGLAFEYLMRPVDMLSLYRENIEIYAKNPNNDGVDALIESYAGKYHKNKTLLTRTVAFFDRLESDLDFRTKSSLTEVSSLNISTSIQTSISLSTINFAAIQPLPTHW